MSRSSPASVTTTFGVRFPLRSLTDVHEELKVCLFLAAHNIMYPGPNDITENFLDIWSKYVPSEQTHVFERGALPCIFDIVRTGSSLTPSCFSGAYYAREVIPDKLAVISLNTLYWYDSNKAVDGCSFDGKEAGSEEMDWLEVQLTIFRARSMQVRA